MDFDGLAFAKLIGWMLMALSVFGRQQSARRSEIHQQMVQSFSACICFIVLAVVIVPVLRKKGCPEATLIVKQFRPPIGAVSIEFPAGLIDQGETAAQAAIRELKEETGYAGKVVSVSPAVAADPGMTSATMILVKMEIDLDEPQNLHPIPHLDDGESIEVEKVDMSRLGTRCEGKLQISCEIMHWIE